MARFSTASHLIFTCLFEWKDATIKVKKKKGIRKKRALKYPTHPRYQSYGKSFKMKTAWFMNPDKVVYQKIVHL